MLRRFLMELLTDLNMGLDPVTVAKSAGLQSFILIYFILYLYSAWHDVGLLERLLQTCQSVAAPYTIVIMEALATSLASNDVTVSSLALSGLCSP